VAETKQQAETKTKKSGIDEGEATGPPVVQSTTTETPAKADESSAPTPNDAEPDHPPVRAAKPDTPIAHALVAGAGEHQPADPETFTADGRVKGAEAE
jgi:hypothetical protein